MRAADGDAGEWRHRALVRMIHRSRMAHLHGQGPAIAGLCDRDHDLAVAGAERMTGVAAGRGRGHLRSSGEGLDDGPGRLDGRFGAVRAAASGGE
jgi:hypothetical protein